MHVDPYTGLTRAVRTVARRHRQHAGRPPSRLAALAQETAAAESARPDGLAPLLEAIRDHRPDNERSDHVIRALLRIEPEEPDAFTVLLAGLAPVLTARLRRRTTTDYRAELLGDLAIVLRYAANQELSATTDLARRLTNRAHTRGHRRTTKPQPTPWEPDWFSWFSHTTREGIPETTAPDPADLATWRTDLDRFLTTARQAADAGAINQKGWQAYQAHNLGRALTGTPQGSTSTDRALASRTARQIRPLVEHHLVAHAS